MPTIGSIAEKSVALALADKLITTPGDIIASAVASFADIMAEKYIKGYNKEMNVLLEVAILTASLYATDYLMNKKTDNYMNYIKKGFSAQIGVSIYKNMK